MYTATQSLFFESSILVTECWKVSYSCQFFLTLAPAPQCDGKHVVFGRIVEGLEILKRIGECLVQMYFLLISTSWEEWAILVEQL